MHNLISVVSKVLHSISAEQVLKSFCCTVSLVVLAVVDPVKFKAALEFLRETVFALYTAAEVPAPSMSAKVELKGQLLKKQILLSFSKLWRLRMRKTYKIFIRLRVERQAA